MKLVCKTVDLFSVALIEMRIKKLAVPSKFIFHFYLLFCSIRLNENEFVDDDDNYSTNNSGLKTLNLRLDEVAHIR
jgi:hypothetical protein